MRAAGGSACAAARWPHRCLWPTAPCAVLLPTRHPAQVPAVSPRLITNMGTSGVNLIDELLPCPGADALSTGLSGGAIAGIVVGSVAGVAGEGARLLLMRSAPCCLDDAGWPAHSPPLTPAPAVLLAGALWLHRRSMAGGKTDPSDPLGADGKFDDNSPGLESVQTTGTPSSGWSQVRRG